MGEIWQLVKAYTKAVTKLSCSAALVILPALLDAA